MTRYEEVSIADITVPSSRRPTIKAKVAAMARSIEAVDLLHPIGLSKDKRLIYGRHRIEAFKLLGRDCIPAMIHDLGELQAELAEIDENLLRNELTAIQEAKALKRRKEIYLELHPETGHGRKASKPPKGDKEGNLPSFGEDTARKTGKSRTTVQRAVKLAKDITDAAAIQLDGTKVADNKAELKRLSALNEDDQITVATAIRKKRAQSVKEAMKLDGIKAPSKPKSSKPPKKLDKKAYFKQWENAIGPLVRLVDKIADGVATKGIHRQVVQKHLNDATEEMMAWMGVK